MGHQSDLFSSKKLIKLDKKGSLIPLLTQYGHLLNSQTLLGKGNDASVFNFLSDPRFVLKLCVKSVGYFRHYNHTLNQFKNHINSLMPYLTPIGQILYEDSNVFLYTQRRCEILNTDQITPEVVAGFFQLLYFLFKHNLLLTDLPPQNVGLLNGLVIIFDYHDLSPFRNHLGQISHIDWWRRLARNLTRFICYSYAEDKRKIYAELMQDCTRRVIKTLSQDSRLPREFIELITYLYKERNQIKTETLCQHFQNCVERLCADFQLKLKRKMNEMN